MRFSNIIRNLPSCAQSVEKIDQFGEENDNEQFLRHFTVFFVYVVYLNMKMFSEIKNSSLQCVLIFEAKWFGILDFFHFVLSQKSKSVCDNSDDPRNGSNTMFQNLILAHKTLCTNTKLITSFSWSKTYLFSYLRIEIFISEAVQDEHHTAIVFPNLSYSIYLLWRNMQQTHIVWVQVWYYN